MQAWKEFATLCSRPVKEGRKFALLFPTHLRLYEGTMFKEFSSVEDAKGYLKEMQDEENGASTLTDWSLAPPSYY